MDTVMMVILFKSKLKLHVRSSELKKKKGTSTIDVPFFYLFNNFQFVRFETVLFITPAILAVMLQ
jgi:hypothetical protein